MLRSVVDQNWRGSLELEPRRLDSLDSNVAAGLLRGGAAPRPRSAQARLFVEVVTGAAIALPILYSVVFFEGWNPLEGPQEQFSHLASNLVGNLLVVAAAFKVTGRLERKVGLVFACAFLVHALLGVAIALMGLDYSRPDLALATSLSITCGVATVCLLHRPLARRVAVIGYGLPPEIQKWFGPAIDVVPESSADLRGYDVILLNFDEALPGAWAKSVSRAVLAGSEVSHVVEYLERAQGRISPDHFDLDQLDWSRIKGPYAATKRSADIALSILVAPLVLLVIGVAGLAIALTLGRPILFVQDRIGKGGKVFHMYKLRTMRARRPGELARATARDDDRIAPLGRFLRRYRIDELPQIWNVLRGEMSLIGPRPEQPELGRQYAEQMPAYSSRHLLRPGITGWAQVCFGYAENYQETREKLTYDLHYIKNFSLALDLRIAVMTFGVVLGGSSVR